MRPLTALLLGPRPALQTAYQAAVGQVCFYLSGPDRARALSQAEKIFQDAMRTGRDRAAIRVLNEGIAALGMYRVGVLQTALSGRAVFGEA